MCTPIAGAIFSAFGKMQEMSAQQDMARAQAKIADNNAKVAEWQAQSAEAKGQRDLENTGRKQADVRGKQMAGMAANGVDLGSGSPAAVLAQTDYYGLEDQRTVAQNTSDEAWALRAKGTDYKNSASLSRAKADNINPVMGGIGSLLGSVGDVADKWSAKTVPASTSSSYSWFKQGSST